MDVAGGNEAMGCRRRRLRVRGCERGCAVVVRRVLAVASRRTSAKKDRIRRVMLGSSRGWKEEEKKKRKT